jgi:hypothetical protein
VTFQSGYIHKKWRLGRKESREREVVEGASSKLGALSKTVAEMLSFQKEGPRLVPG